MVIDSTASNANDNKKPCPCCKRPAVAMHRPFCSSRCAKIDLNRWLSGQYAIKTNESRDEESDGINSDDD